MLSFLSRTTEEEPLSAESAKISVLLLQNLELLFLLLESPSFFEHLKEVGTCDGTGRQEGLKLEQSLVRVCF